MKMVSITTPENIEVKYRLAGIGSRMVAAFLDYLIQGVIYLVILISLGAMRDPMQYIESQSSYFVAIVICIVAFINYGYFTILEMLMNGKTLGKKVLGLRTIRKNGQPMDIKHSLIRNLFRIFIDNYIVGMVMIFFRGDYSRLGDLLASTMVIEEEKEKFYFEHNEFLEKLKNRLTEDEKELIITYLNEKEEVKIGKEKLKDKLMDYFKSKYASTDTEVINMIEKIVYEY
ncbi:RDD family protein [Crassaminicella thermophila]|uniref:RDD family protein n=1 Tax=Crassaminicella thermophila TaxID=2599308 RepID=A0A5C0SG05_CRATE|nr:RDD family protein [Crassaminicella thermophila]QEK12676.1 RDD family protein [Crassaminicella thermophila]